MNNIELMWDGEEFNNRYDVDLRWIEMICFYEFMLFLKGNINSL